MKKFTFSIRNLEEFVNLDIVKQRKIKSTSFNKPLQQQKFFLEESNPNLKSFIDVISNYTLEKVLFKLVANLSQQYELLKLVLAKCNNLQEIVVNNNKTFKKVRDAADHGILDSISVNVWHLEIIKYLNDLTQAIAGINADGCLSSIVVENLSIHTS